MGLSIEAEAERSVAGNLQESGREPDYREQHGSYPDESGRHAFGPGKEQQSGGGCFEEHWGAYNPGGKAGVSFSVGWEVLDADPAEEWVVDHLNEPDQADQK